MSSKASRNTLVVPVVLLGLLSCNFQSYPERHRFPNVKVQFVNQTTGWIVGPRLLGTTDGGHTWTVLRDAGPGTILTEITNFEAKRIQFVAPEIGFALSDDMKSVVKTKDGGKSWPLVLRLPIKEEEPLLQTLFFVSPERGWAIGEYVYATEDGGQTWRRLAKTPSKDPQRQTPFRIAEGYDPDLWFMGPNKGIMARKDGDVYQTTDGGQNWKMTWRVDEFLADVFFIDDQIGWVVGSRGFVGRSSDGGATWAKSRVSTESTLNCVFFLDRSTGWAGDSEGTVFYTRDGGESWTRADMGTGRNTRGRLASLTFSDAQHGWAVGGNPYDELKPTSAPTNTILTTVDGGKSWQVTSIPN